MISLNLKVIELNLNLQAGKETIKKMELEEKLEVEKLAFSKQKSFNDGADFSEESSNYAMKDLQMQATSSVLTQANS